MKSNGRMLVAGARSLLCMSCPGISAKSPENQKIHVFFFPTVLPYTRCSVQRLKNPSSKEPES